MRATATASMRLPAPSSPTSLGAEDPPRAPLGQHLDHDRPGLGQVAGPSRRLDLADDVLQSGGDGLALGQAGAGHLGGAQLGDRGADHAGERGVPAAQVDAGHPGLPVGDGAQRDVDREAGHQVVGLGTVPGRPDAVDCPSAGVG